MHYISIQDLQGTIGQSVDLNQIEQKNELFRKIDESSQLDTINLSGKKYKKEEIKSFISSLDSKKILYLNWIEQHKDLKSILLQKFPSHVFVDSFKWQEHAMYTAFTQYLGQFLSPVLLTHKHEKSIEKLHLIFSYCQLLSKDDRMLVEQQLFKPIEEKIEHLKVKIAQVETEKDLSAVIQPICNDDITGIINLLSRASYSSKVWYVDQLLWVIQQKGCTIRLANWILKQLEKIDLNPEHRQRITQLKKDLAKGKISVKNANLSKQKKLPVKRLIGFVSLIALICFSVWIIWEKPFSENDDQLFQTSSAYEQFTKAERIKIDSLLREIQQDHIPEDNQIDPNQPILGNGMSMSIRVPLNNLRMEKLYQDFMIDADLQEKGQVDSCASYPFKTAVSTFYKGIMNARTRNANVDVMMKNESGYDVSVYIFEDKMNGRIYSALIKKGTTVELKVNQEDQLLFLPGNELGRFVSPKNAAELPSSDFDHHFCSVDMNYSEALLNFYTVRNPQSGKNKLMLSGDLNSYFSVVDLYGVLELR